jgi:hypothetical protein
MACIAPRSGSQAHRNKNRSIMRSSEDCLNADTCSSGWQIFILSQRTAGRGVRRKAGQREASKAANASWRRRMADACAVKRGGLEAFLEPLRLAVVHVKRHSRGRRWESERAEMSSGIEFHGGDHEICHPQCPQLMGTQFWKTRQTSIQAHTLHLDYRRHYCSKKQPSRVWYAIT